MAIVILIVLGCLIVTSFISDMVTMLLFFNLGIPMLANTNISPTAVTILIVCMSAYSCLVPTASATAPLFFADDNITVKNSLKWNLVMMVAACAVGLIVVLPLGRLILG
jgi:di/tricarboxylate transporter